MNKEKTKSAKITKVQLAVRINYGILAISVIFLPEITVRWGWWQVIVIWFLSGINMLVLYHMWWKKLPDKTKEIISSPHMASVISAAWINYGIIAIAFFYLPEITLHWGGWPIVVIWFLSVVNVFVLFGIWRRKLSEKSKKTIMAKNDSEKDRERSEYNGWMMSDSFMKRAAAVWWYNSIFSVFLVLLVMVLYWSVKSYS